MPRQFKVGDRVIVGSLPDDEKMPGIITAFTHIDEQLVALVYLKDGLWGWRGNHESPDGDHGITYISTLVASIGNLVLVEN